jgi:hypothetical protein
LGCCTFSPLLRVTLFEKEVGANSRVVGADQLT